MTTLTPPRGGGLTLAVVSAATFGTSGAFAASLLGSGWTAGAAVLVRIALAGAVLTVPALLQLRGRRHLLRRRARVLATYGAVAVGGAQFCYFNAVGHVSVGIALLLEYLGVFLVVAWMWARHGQRPRRLTVVGALVAVLGLVLVLDVTGSVRLDPVGVLWGLGAAAGLATYFVLSGNAQEDLPPLAMAWGGMVVGATVLGVLGAIGLLDLAVSTQDVRFVGRDVSWVVPVLGLSLVAAVVSYLTGMAASRRLGARLASFVGLTEVLFAVLFAWVLLGQLPTPVQGVGAVVILAGVTLVKLDERPGVATRPRAAGPSGRGPASSPAEAAAGAAGRS